MCDSVMFFFEPKALEYNQDLDAAVRRVVAAVGIGWLVTAAAAIGYPVLAIAPRNVPFFLHSLNLLILHVEVFFLFISLLYPATFPSLPCIS